MKANSESTGDDFHQFFFNIVTSTLSTGEGHDISIIVMVVGLNGGVSGHGGCVCVSVLFLWLNRILGQTDGP